MSAGGTYALLLRMDAPQTVRVGALGTFEFPPGWYLYVGSAHGPGGLAARTAYHQRTDKKRFHWHIDYLRAVAALAEVWSHTGPERLECPWAAAAAALPGATIVAPRFGASDCRCPSHLFYFTGQPERVEFERLINSRLATTGSGDFFDRIYKI
jgi:Uri superfamily endonuclease